MHFEVEIPKLPQVKYDKDYETNYLDLPTKNHILEAVEVSPIDLKAVILFMSSSGTAKAETLSLSVNQFIKACENYHNGGSIDSVLNTLSRRNDVVPALSLKESKLKNTTIHSAHLRRVQLLLNTLKHAGI